MFTIITLAYNRLDYTRQSLEAMRSQTYKDLEIIVVNNGATSEIIDYLINVKASDNRVKIVHFKENQFWDNGDQIMLRVCCNAALKEATGEYIFYQSDDDLMANDYVEKMVKLFGDNPDCTSAAGIIKHIDAQGQMLDKGSRTVNYRPRYMPGHLLVLNTLCKGEYGNEVMFSAPGTVFTFKREDLVKAGGYHESMEFSQLYGVVPFGTTGFDEAAILYWRRHKDQTNKFTTLTGWIGLRETVELIKDWQIEERWQVFGNGIARYVMRRLWETIYGTAASWFVVNLYFFRFKACLKILKDARSSFYFWRKLPMLLWTERRQLWWYLRPKLQLVKNRVLK